MSAQSCAHPVQYDFISFFLLLGHKGLEANDGPWRMKSVLIILMLLQPRPTQVPGIQVDWEACRQVCSVILNIINQALCFNVSNFPEFPLKSKFGRTGSTASSPILFLPTCLYRCICMQINMNLKLYKFFMLK